MSARPDIIEKKEGKKLYDFQHRAIEEIFERLRKYPERYSLLYQLPTGGGKTVIFSKIAKHYIHETKRKVLILTHRIELCRQTSAMLDEFGVPNKIINSKVKEVCASDNHMCYVAMVETLNNRLHDEAVEIENLGLVIVDEAHNNSFRKLFKFFRDKILLGVTATPLSSNINLPLREVYKELIVGDSIASLIKKGFLAKATTYSYDVILSSLKIGINGDYTVRSSELLYNNYAMQDKLLHAYEQKAKGKKTLIFNNGINTSRHVYKLFTDAGYAIRHLDHTQSEEERKEILTWLKETPDAIVTSVSILTTGFDEPTVEAIILNRATRSLTLYHQMIGRGSRVLPNKKEFIVIDLGNNALRFGLWDAPIDWQEIFAHPEQYYEQLVSDETIERNFKYTMPLEVKQRFANSDDITFNVKEEYEKIKHSGHRPMTIIEQSIRQHARMCIENAQTLREARELAELLDEEIQFRIKDYSYCICKSTPNYLTWLHEEYKRRLTLLIATEFRNRITHSAA
ncbi:MAG: DEAD/DEAH box helicase [Chitinophagales bacterium]|nr:MAG: DEAD/DEAH box helicase [Chitinophagales bacterium]